MSGGFIVNAFGIEQIDYDGSGTHAFYLNDSKFQLIPLNDRRNTNEPLKIMTPSNNIEFPFTLTTPMTAIAGRKIIQLKSQNSSMWPIDENVYKADNILSINLCINSGWSTVPNTSFNDDFIITTLDYLKLYRSENDFVLIKPELTITIVPVIDKTIQNSWSYANFTYVTVTYEIPFKYINPVDGSLKYLYIKDIPLINIWDGTNSIMWISIENNFTMQTVENANILMYHADLILSQLAKMQNALIDAMNSSGSSGSGAVVTAVNNNAQTVANEMKNTGNKIVTAVDSAANKLIEFDLGEVPDEIIEELAAQDKVVNEYKEQFDSAYDKALRDYNLPSAVDSVISDDFFSSVIRPFYNYVMSGQIPMVSFLAGGVILLIVVVMVLKR